MLYKIRLQGCEVGYLESAGSSHGDDITRSREIIRGINITTLVWPADKVHTLVAGR
jgi:hypothetical protein